MSTKKPPVTTPLHLLQQLSQNLLVHLEEACTQALQDAEKALAKLEKQRSKVQEKLHEARAKLQDAALAGKAKAQARGRKAVDELEPLLDELKARQAETRDYIVRLRHDTLEALELAQGIAQVREAAARTLMAPGTPPAAQPQSKPAPKAAARKPAASRRTKPAAAAGEATAPAKRTPRPAAAAEQPAKPAAPRKPAARR
ncbi:AlgP family protein, partial [Azotobacter chroococcum]|nr:AlgP family protein [Azotobacter chroococcum]